MLYHIIKPVKIKFAIQKTGSDDFYFLFYLQTFEINIFSDFHIYFICLVYFSATGTTSPVYFYSIDAQLKALIDRTVARWTEIKNKDFYYIVTCANGKTRLDRAIECFRGYADCVNGAKECGIIYGHGVYQKGEIKDKPAMKEAYEMDKAIL